LILLVFSNSCECRFQMPLGVDESNKWLHGTSNRGAWRGILPASGSGESGASSESERMAHEGGSLSLSQGFEPAGRYSRDPSFYRNEAGLKPDHF